MSKEKDTTKKDPLTDLKTEKDPLVDLGFEGKKDDSSLSTDRLESKIKEDKIILLKQILEDIKRQVNNALELLSTQIGLAEKDKEARGPDHACKAKMVGDMIVEGATRIIEGVFNGQQMIGPDGKEYSVPANYASKSKLVEGDILKLTILPDGRFIYKQIGPQKRRNLKGILIKDEATNEYRVLAEGKFYKVLLASITYYKGEPGDEVVILVPETMESSWAAVENILKKPILIEETGQPKNFEL